MKIFFHAKSLCEGNNSSEISATQYQEFDRNMNIHQWKWSAAVLYLSFLSFYLCVKLAKNDKNQKG
jgi:hypothetical protein